ncbi:DUF7121 family protein [Methanococcus voltae]|uniref:Uncharacterized coiled-coil DUF342 family protein n=2 Tax=Methanococcus voltae TaxID=2188 RepID=A0A8J7S446_METVO|nr:hypothetical protein [Methanococcus voltae]MBP2171982.1 uncharacterized coiled-coil DUF342 family protein [Methanococcus voltae]MBP2201063.1 uncharacterized coiled-coil DUF342 family protein [Methanococcus voltae]MCS3921786.1 uncharacterized coiled-coil DUF342 family protein [Methanococcus voltae PS]
MEYEPIKTQLDKINTKIKELYEEAKELKKIRDDANEKVKEFKETREAINTDVKNRIEQIRDLKQKRAGLLEEFKMMKLTKNQIAEKIEQLEMQLETSATDMDREQALAAQIQSYQELYKRASELEELNETIKEMSDNISVLVNESSDEHKKVLENARTSAEKHQELLLAYNEINQLKSKASELHEQLKNLKLQEISQDSVE